MRSYPSIYNLGHRAVRDLLLVPHYIEEKVDGSQFSFGLYYDGVPQPNDSEMDPNTFPPTLRVRSKGAEMLVDAPEKMFAKAVESVKERQHLLTPGWTYRGEYLRVPKHNTLAYDRTPTSHIILFDVDKGEGDMLNPFELAKEATHIGLESVPQLATYEAGRSTLEDFRNILDNTVSVLGGQKIEGIVVKQFGPDYLYGTDKKTLIGKFVSEQFKEAHKSEWKKTSPNSGDILVALGKQYCHPGRWLKAVQHLREAGTLTDSPKDIGALLIEVQKDLGKEEKEAIQKALWKWARPHIMRAATRGLPEWYKEQLLKLQFEGSTEQAMEAAVAADYTVETIDHTVVEDVIF